MYFAFDQAVTWVGNNKNYLEQVYQKTQNNLILCPSFESLYLIASQLKNSPISLGAQDCSEHTKGAFTGQVAAISLAEIGCSYCIVGHSERRDYQHETDTQIAQKIEQLIENNIIPIVCIGESKEDYEQNQTQIIIQKQLDAIGKVVKNNQLKTPFYIAYEPIWAIGKGNIPDKTYLQEVLADIHANIQAWPNKNTTGLLYGGSINAQNISEFKDINFLEGFLIGRASTDFQEFKKIVESL